MEVVQHTWIIPKSLSMVGIVQGRDIETQTLENLLKSVWYWMFHRAHWLIIVLDFDFSSTMKVKYIFNSHLYSQIILQCFRVESHVFCNSLHLMTQKFSLMFMLPLSGFSAFLNVMANSQLHAEFLLSFILVQLFVHTVPH